MKRLVGGDYLLDLSSIEIEESIDGTTKTNITDSDVLEQLTNLKKYIKNPEMAKPVWVKLKNGENDELVIARGTFAIVDTGEFEICVQLDGYKLVIFIEFTQVLNSDDEPLDDWYIDTNDAKYLFTSDAQNVDAIIDNKYISVINGSFQNDFLQGSTLVESFCKVVRNFNELQFICNFRIRNNTENAITLLTDTMIAYYNVPEELQSKIYAHNGNACSRDESSSQGSIAMATLFISQESGATDTNGPRYANLYHFQGLIRFYFEGGNFSIGAGELRDFEARISLAL